MCGICGIYYYDSSRKTPERLIERMNYIQRHRGPDDFGVWVKDNVGLGQARLAIIDLSPTGHQPMCNEDGSVWVTFNGEIYNYLEIRQALLAKGHSLRSNSDTEVIVHLWEEKGPALVEDLRGMFALALWDDRRKALFLARDRLGKKPLFYADLPDRIVFGSEVKAILQDPDFTVEPDYEAIHHYLVYQSVPAPLSAFKGVKKLPPAHYLLAQNGRVQVKRYWNLEYRDQLSVQGEAAEKALAGEIIERLREAVRIRLMSEVPLGAFLSGGVDSSIVVALMAGLMDQPVKTFSIGFAEDAYNELPYARMVAERYHTEHHEFVVTPDAKAILPQLVWHYNEPFADSSAIPTYYVSQLARRHVTVVLTGDAGDENFAGYPRYQFSGRFAPDYGAAYPSILQRLLNPAADARTAPFAPRGFPTWRSLRRLAGLKRPRLYYYYRVTHFNEGILSQLYTPSFAERVAGSYPVDILLEKFRQARTPDFTDSLMYLDLNLYLPDTLMTKTDIAGMTHSLEARMPLLDHQFLEFTARIPSALKLKDGQLSKYIFKKAVEPYLPGEVIYREKQGFAIPLDQWFRGELKELAYDTLLSQKAAERGLFRREAVEGILNSHQAGDSRQYLIWNLLMLELWHQMFIDRTLTPPPLEDYNPALAAERVHAR